MKTLPKSMLGLPVSSGIPPVVLEETNTPIYSPLPLPPRTRRGALLSYPDCSGLTRYGVDAAIGCLVYGGYRVADILSVTWADVLPGDRLLVRASKRGSASICPLLGCSSLARLIPPSDMGRYVFSCSYGQVYRRMSRSGYRMQPLNHINASVTHTPRRSLAEAAYAIAGRTAAGQVLNHVSKNTIDYYVPPHKKFPQCLLFVPVNGQDFVTVSPHPPPRTDCFLRTWYPSNAVAYWLQYSEFESCLGGEDNLLAGYDAMWNHIYTFIGEQVVYWRYRAIFDERGRDSQMKGPWSAAWHFNVKWRPQT